MLNASLKILSLLYPYIHPSPQIVQQEVALEKISELMDISVFRYLEYKYSQYVMLLAKLLLCKQNQNFWLLHFVVANKPHAHADSAFSCTAAEKMIRTNRASLVHETRR